MSQTQIFFLPLSQVEGRLDPHFYQTKYQHLQHKISAMPHKKLRNVCSFSKETWDGVTGFNVVFPYLEISDIDLSTGTFELPKNILIADAPSRAQMIVRHGDYVVSLTRPSRGAIGCSGFNHPEIFIASTGFAVLRKPNQEHVDTDYLFYLLRSNLVLEQFEQRSSGGNYPAINEEEMGRVLLPLPKLELQKEIALFMQEAYEKKYALEEKSKGLLEEIDAVIYRHLNLNPIKIAKNPIDFGIFKVELRLIRGNPFDPKSHSPRSTALLKLLSKSRFPQWRLSDLIEHRRSGDWGEDDDIISNDHTRCLVIRGTDFDNKFNFNFDKNFVKHRKILNTKLKQMQIFAGDILIEKSGGGPYQPVGRVAMLSQQLLDEQPIAYSNFVEKIRPDIQKIMPEYLHIYLRFIHSIGITDLLQSQTNGIRNLMLHRYLALPVSVPSKDEQADLVNQVESILSHANSLQQQAMSLLAKAKQKMETMILGEASSA